MYKNCFWTGGGPCETSGKQDASCEVILSNGSLLWKAAPSSPVGVYLYKILIYNISHQNISSLELPNKVSSYMYQGYNDQLRQRDLSYTVCVECVG